MKDTCGISQIMRIVKKYENPKYLHSDFIMQNVDFHISQLREIISNVENAIEAVGNEINMWAENIGEVYAVDDANTIFKKIQLLMLKRYVNRKYDKSLKEIRELQIVKEKLTDILNKLIVLSNW